MTGSVGACLGEADVALAAMEALAQASMRLDAALVLTAAQQSTAIGAALLAQRDVADPGELSVTARERWRARAKARTRGEIAPAIGWTPGETVHLVALACAPAAFRAPVVDQMTRGVLPWRLARSLWRACQGLPVAEAVHVATVMCGDDPDTCVPERLTPEGTVATGPWEHRAFYAALEREVAKLTHADDTDPQDQAAARAVRDAAWAGRGVIARVDQDGTGTLTVITSALWVAGIKDRLSGAARTARAAGDGRTLAQLESDIARTLLAHATVGFADQPLPTPTTPPDQDDSAPAGGDAPPGQSDRAGGDAPADRAAPGEAGPAAQDLARAGWSPQLIQALSGLPAATLQVIVPLIGLHDPATAHTLPTLGRTSTRPIDPIDPDGSDGPGDDSALGQGQAGGQGPGAGAGGHTGRPGCPGCLPSTRRDHTTRDRTRNPDHEESPAHGEDSAQQDDRVQEGDCVCGGGDSGPGADPPGQDRTATAAGRRLWVGELLGSFGTFVSPEQVRALALEPGTTMARLLVDPADGRCVERSLTTYRMDAAMRAQLLAADVTCRAPACTRTGSHCQVDHVTEYGTPGGTTTETNAQLLHTGHHEPKTAKDWDAHLAANRDLTWTSLLGRIYRTRAWDYRRYLTLLVDALDTVHDTAPQDRADQINHQIYLALTHHDLTEPLNPGDDDPEPDLIRYGGWALIGLTHRDPTTGHRVPGPSPATTAHALAQRATTNPPPPGSTTGTTGTTGPVGPVRGSGGQDQDDRTGKTTGRSKSTNRTKDDGTDGTNNTDVPRRWGMQSMIRLGDDKASRAAWRLMTDEDIPPF
ncbi:hypothetical protein [Ornithinimicrobium flavum]|uniref:hypothetical protein n=1 Tax=Ornithinimicrobium flavum TaxID=1288636 RepID=UPI0010703CFE|nr:hypothetical protein [Ornithinimicrobium flavum]